MARVWGAVVVSVAGVAGWSSPTPPLARIRFKALALSHGGLLAPHMAKVVSSAVRRLKDANSVFPRADPPHGHRLPPYAAAVAATARPRLPRLRLLFTDDLGNTAVATSGLSYNLHSCQG